MRKTKFVLSFLFLSESGGGTSNGPSSFTYEFHGDPRATFEAFFGSSNPFASFFSRDPFESGSLFDNDDFFGMGLGHGLGGGLGLGGAFRSHSFNVHTPLKKGKVQDPPIEHDLYVTLEEIYNGCNKKMKISRNIIQPDGERISELLFRIFIRPFPFLRKQQKRG